APSGVQRFDSAVFLFEPAAEASLGGRGIGIDCAVATVFVVCLPADEGRVIPHHVSDNTGDAGCFFAIAEVRKVVVATRAKAAFAALRIDGEHIWVLVCHPARRSGRGRADNDLKAIFVQYVHRPNEPFELQITGRWLKTRPCEFADPYDFY